MKGDPQRYSAASHSDSSAQSGESQTDIRELSNMPVCLQNLPVSGSESISDSARQDLFPAAGESDALTILSDSPTVAGAAPYSAAPYSAAAPTVTVEFVALVSMMCHCFKPTPARNI